MSFPIATVRRLTQRAGADVFAHPATRVLRQRRPDRVRNVGSTSRPSAAELRRPGDWRRIVSSEPLAATRTVGSARAALYAAKNDARPPDLRRGASSARRTVDAQGAEGGVRDGLLTEGVLHTLDPGDTRLGGLLGRMRRLVARPAVTAPETRPWLRADVVFFRQG